MGFPLGCCNSSSYLLIPLVFTFNKSNQKCVRSVPTFTWFRINLLYSDWLLETLLVCRHNPYETIAKIICFAWKHKHPLHRSAFTYSDDYIPSRLDFAKERFGGCFKSEEVENVKTFLRIISVLIAIGPVFVLQVPASYLVFPLFSIHVLKYHQHFGKDFCTSEAIWETIMGSGTMMTLLSMLLLFPIHIWVTFSLLRNKMPKILTRLGIGIVLSLLGVASLLIINVVGHSLNRNNVNGSSHTQCMFQAKVYNNRSLSYPALNMHWAALIPPNIFLNIGPLIVITTTFEFISAQSPQSMKGLLVGVSFTIRGLFQLLNSILIVPFSLKDPWATGRMLEGPPVISCGFVYLLLTLVIGLIGLVAFIVLAKRYKHRVRDEGQFHQHNVEEIFDRYLADSANSCSSSDD